MYHPSKNQREYLSATHLQGNQVFKKIACLSDGINHTIELIWNSERGTDMISK